MILYFTGTGNSQYAAEYLNSILERELVSINECMKKGEHPDFTAEDSFIFVLPTYAWRMPRAAEEFIRSCTFHGVKDAWFVLTCGGSMGSAGEYAKKLCEEKGLNYRGTADVAMPENYIALFSVPPEEKVPLIMEKARQRLKSVAETIMKDQDLTQKCKKSDFLSGMVNEGFYKFYVSDKSFRVKENCTGCGFCEEICPLKNITLTEGRPVWGGNCTHCMACICGCPAEAIEYGKRTEGKRRYWCEPFDK